jgi:hypothetical protein
MANENCLTPGFEPVLTDPSRGPLPDEVHRGSGRVSPQREGGFPNPSAQQKRQPSPWGEGARRRRAGEGSFHCMKPGTSWNLRIRV